MICLEKLPCRLVSLEIVQLFSIYCSRHRRSLNLEETGLVAVDNLEKAGEPDLNPKEAACSSSAEEDVLAASSSWVLRPFLVAAVGRLRTQYRLYDRGGTDRKDSRDGIRWK